MHPYTLILLSSNSPETTWLKETKVGVLQGITRVFKNDIGKKTFHKDDF